MKTLVVMTAVFFFCMVCFFWVAHEKRKEDLHDLRAQAANHLLPSGLKVMLCGFRVKDNRVLGRIGTTNGWMCGNLVVKYRIDGEIVEEQVPLNEIIPSVRVFNEKMIQKERQRHRESWWTGDKEEEDA